MSPDLEHLHSVLLGMERDAWDLGGPPIFTTDEYAVRFRVILLCAAAARLVCAEQQGWVVRCAPRRPRGPETDAFWEITVRPDDDP